MEVEIILADDHPLMLIGLQNFLEDNGFSISGTASNGKKALHEIERKRPSLAILDYEMPVMTGLEVAEMCLKKNISTKIILLTLHLEANIFQKAQALKVAGYISKEFAADELLKCIRSVLETGEYFSDKTMELVNSGKNVTQSGDLTPTEKKILRLIADGLTSHEISEQLFVSDRTVDKHRSNIIKKLNLDKKHNTLVIWAQKNKEMNF